jgi:hypothetical protein
MNPLQVADLLLFDLQAVLLGVHLWSLRKRLDERDVAELITAYRNGTTAASLATRRLRLLRLQPW